MEGVARLVLGLVPPSAEAKGHHFAFGQVAGGDTRLAAIRYWVWWWDLALIPDNHARPIAPCARAALDYSVVDLGVFSAQCLGNRGPVLWSAKSYGVGQAART